VFERVVIGVDPGMAATGVAAVATGPRGQARVLAADTVRTPAGAPEDQRLRSVYRAVRRAIGAHHPEALAVERLMWGRNVGSAMGVARASGVVLLAAAEAGVPVREYAPLEVKMAVAGNGSAAKPQVHQALRRLHRISEVPEEPDAADAVAVAVCHLSQSPALRRASR
jgi:crossover junction endodeoxyribonuclease RuvC